MIRFDSGFSTAPFASISVPSRNVTFLRLAHCRRKLAKALTMEAHCEMAHPPGDHW